MIFKKSTSGTAGTEFKNPLSFMPLEGMEKFKGEKTRYKKAKPFPHIVMDDFLDPDVLRTVVNEFPESNQDWKRVDSEHELKTSFSSAEELGPNTWLLINSLNSGTFLDFLTSVTGIKGLIADPYLRGGGLHNILPGGKLGVHADFNYYKKLKLYRRLNLIVYLNEPWEEDWGGHIEFWDENMTECVQKVLPVFNRAVIFSTFNKSFHGHPTPLKCPEGHSRKSLALYYYTTDYPYEDDMEPHTTIFKETPDS